MKPGQARVLVLLVVLFVLEMIPHPALLAGLTQIKYNLNTNLSKKASS